MYDSLFSKAKSSNYRPLLAANPKFSALETSKGSGDAAPVKAEWVEAVVCR